MALHGTIRFSNKMTKDSWEAMLRQFGLVSTQRADLVNPLTGETVEVKDPPNLLALVKDKTSSTVGLVRCSRLFFDGGIGPEAELAFQGTGKFFEGQINKIASYLEGTCDFS
jgi:hypothetical protein